MASIPPENGKGPAVLEVEGPLTLFTVRSERARLLEFLGKHKVLVINLSQVSECDTAGIQLLCACAKSAKTAGVSLRFEGAANLVESVARCLGLEALFRN
jgi:anti-anti-sigma regulatory factor